MYAFNLDFTLINATNGVMTGKLVFNHAMS